MISDFTGSDLVVGELVGLRGFRVGIDGQLLSVAYSNYEWVPGENIATCVSLNRSIQSMGDAIGRLGDAMAAFSRNLDAMVRGETPPPLAIQPVAAIKPREHTVGQLDCTCGFYAYTTNLLPQPYLHSGNVRGIVAGYGRVTEGSRGFRASRARILALVPPDNTLRYGVLPPNAVGWLKARTRYCGIPVYDSLDAALEQHPLVGIA